MKQSEIFADAKWICAGEYSHEGASKLDEGGIPHFPVIRSHFDLKKVKKATLYVIGLGFFYCYINGKRISEDAFLPLYTDYEPKADYPKDEVVTGHRIYVPHYDVTDLLREGENVLAIHYGGGWYVRETFHYRDPNYGFGSAKAIYRLEVETEDGKYDIVSSERDLVGDSYVKTYVISAYENHDYNGFDDNCFETDYDDSSWKNAILAKPLDTEYMFTDCPADRILEELSPVFTVESDGMKCYDSGRNCAQIPVLKLKGKKGDVVTVEFAEEKNPDGSPDMQFHYGQKVSFVCDGKERIVRPMFTWFAYRYFKVSGNADVVCTRVIHTNVEVDSYFDCDNETLNWLYKAFLNTQLSNMHLGVPSDCPHIERRGYTGDGQLVCHSAMSTIAAKDFYLKWIGDISDCQDIYSGHVQYTAPYMRAGGGPGGWGSAIVEVPYEYYKQYGDAEPMRKMYGQMLRYFDYLDAHSLNDIVVSDQPGQWCLGDWCAPDPVIIPSGFVNNYFYIKSMRRVIKIARIIGRESDIPMLEKRIEKRLEVTHRAYFNTHDSNYIGCMQGANAFAIDLGIGDSRTYTKMVERYTKLGRFDTGIFGTELVTRMLFEHGNGELAANLLMSEETMSFNGMMKAGATTLWENWPLSHWDRSRNHPMFGAVVGCIFDYLVGIRQDDDVAGYETVVIAPILVSRLNRITAKRTLPGGEITVSYKKNGENVDFAITVPKGQKAVFRFGGKETVLCDGENKFTEKI